MIPIDIKDKPRVVRGQGKHNHLEAFCHMMYISDDGRQIEWLWNSRDGVTPFVISSSSGKSMTHSYFGEDRYDPNYLPKVGDRIFVDCTPDMIRDNAKEFVNKYWDDGEIPMKSVFDDKNKEEVIKHFIEEWTKPGAPHVLVVTKEAQKVSSL
jgi:hypothetical protein